MIGLTLGQIADAVGGAVEPRHRRSVVQRVVTDSRQVQAGDLFVAIRGVRFDGHEFLAESAARGAVGALCDRRGPASSGSRSTASSPRIVVDDTIAALGRLGSFYRRSVMSRATVVVAVTGSNGKTTTKHLIDHVLKDFLQGRAAPRSFNNSIGVPLTLLAVDGGDRYVVVEIGTNAPGEIAALAAIAAPDIGVITSIGEAHLEGLGDLPGVAAEKSSLLRFLRPDGLAVVNIDRPEIRPHVASKLRAALITFGLSTHADVTVRDVTADPGGSRFTLDGRYDVTLPLAGAHHATNAAAAYVVARRFGLGPDEIVHRLASFPAVDGRGRVSDRGGVRIVDDSYNANPSSMAAAIDTLRRAAGRRVLVMGDMRELGPAGGELHRRTIDAALSSGIDIVLAVGPEMSAAASDSIAYDHSKSEGRGGRLRPCHTIDSAADALTGVVRPGDTVWIKGSRAMGMERLVSALHERLAAPVAGVTNEEPSVGK